MKSLATVLGPHAYALIKYDTPPQGDLNTAVEITSSHGSTRWGWYKCRFISMC
ncbi:MAG: hypothetical protein ABWK05_09165 [Pyrobaculum sp.]